MGLDMYVWKAKKLSAEEGKKVRSEEHTSNSSHLRSSRMPSSA